MAGFEFEVSGGGDLDAYLKRLQGLASGAWKPDFYDHCGYACNALVGKEFQEGKDPFGAPWMPTQRGNPPLIGPTKALSTSPQYEATATGFILKVTDRKAEWHQRGTFVTGTDGSRRRHIWPRPMLPIGNDMPPAWREEIRREYRITLIEALQL